MTDWPLIGRGKEFAYLRALAEDTNCRGAVLAAPAGVGKTRLAAEVARAAEHAGMLTLLATGSAAITRVPLGAMASTLSAYAGASGASRDDDPGAFLQDVVQHVIEQARPRRLFLLIDDAHLLDNASAALVQQLAQRPEVFVLATVRTREQPPDAITALWKDGLLERVELEMLASDAVQLLLTAVLGGPLDGAALAELTARSQGNLLFLREMVIAARNDGSLRFEHDLWRLLGESEPSDLLVELVEARIGRLATPERRLLELLAIGEPLGSREVDALASVELAERLEDAGLIASRNDGQRLEIRLAHPVYGEVLRSRLSGLQSRRLARALAEVLEATGLRRRDDELRVAVWRLSAGGGTPEQLLAAALAARWRHDLSLAHRLASAAADAGAGFEAELLSAHLLLRLGRPDEADALFTRLGNEPVERDRIRATLARVDVAQARDRPHEMRRLLAQLDIPTDTDLRAAVAARECVATLTLDGPKAALALPVPEFDRTQGDAGFALFSSHAICLARMGRSELAGREIERMLAGVDAGDSPRLGWWRIPHASSISQQLVQSGRLADAIALLHQQYDQAIGIGSAEMQMAAAYSLGRRYLEAGRLRTAAKLVHEALALTEQLDYALIRHECLRAIALIEALTQRPTEARRALARVPAAHREFAYSYGLTSEAIAWTQIAEGDLAGARQRFEEAAEHCLDLGDLTHSAAAFHGLTRIGHAADAVDGLTRLNAEMDGPWTSLYLRHAQALVQDDGAGLEDAAREFQALGALLLAAECAADAATAWQRAGEQRRATATRNLAVGLSERCEGARTPALRNLGERDQLTVGERETALYAAAGESNRVIAQRLHLSVRTVETRLQGVYYKLGISRRSELDAALKLRSSDGQSPL
jgi:ATP/maltotriose-dependent transcriptional regulator MalT